MDLPQLDREGAKLTTLRAVSHRKQRTAVLVLGMHRSGTSAFAGMLSLLGLPIGSNPMLSDAENPKGYFENHRIVEFNDRLLAQFGSRWDDPRPLTQERVLSAVARSAAHDLAELLRAEFAEEPLVVIKDPRLCRLLPIWKEALTAADRQLVAVAPLRHPLEVAASLQRRDSLSRAHGLFLWLGHVLAAERETRRLPRAFIPFDELLGDWRSVVARIGEALELDWPHDPASVGAEIDAFLSSELRHRTSVEEEVATCDRLHALGLRAWGALQRSPLGAAEEAALDEVTRELDVALAVLSPLIGELVEIRAQANDDARLGAEIDRREEIEELARSEIARRVELEARLRFEVERHHLARREAERQLEALLGSTLWRVTAPLRSAAMRLPAPARRALRGGAKLLWWTMTLRLATRLRERRHASQSPPVSEPQPETPKEASEEAESGEDIEVSTPDTIELPYRGLLENMALPTIAKAIARLRRFPLFSPDDYLRLRADVAAGPMDPYAHFLCFGAYEDQRWFRGDHIARDIGKYVGGAGRDKGETQAGATSPNDESAIAALAARSLPIGIYVGSMDNIFMREIAEDLAADLESIGATVAMHDEMSPIEHRPPISIFVAVDEFFLSDRGREWVREDVVANAFMFEVEQIQTHWFTNGLPLVLLSRGVIDLDFQTADLFRKTGLPALHYTPAPRTNSSALLVEDYFHPLFQVLPAAAKGPPEPYRPIGERALDIAFFGVQSPHRDNFFARHAPFLADYETFIHCPLAGRGPIAGERAALTRLATHVCGHAKISLNLHEEEFPYFEWHRVVRLGMSSGSVVVSEPCLPHPDFQPGVHYFEENQRHIPDLLEWLLRTEEGRREAERVRSNVQLLIGDKSRRRQNAARLLEFLVDHHAP